MAVVNALHTPAILEGDGLVAISLKTLIDLAKPAAGLKLHQLTSRSIQSGGFLSAFTGRGMEFDETRIYQQGDDIRSIDWKVTARTGKAHTKLFREEREKPVFISVDSRPAMHFATRGVYKSVQAKKLAALLAWTASQKGDRIGGQVFSQTSCKEFKPQNGNHAVLHFLNALVMPEPAANNDFSLTQVLARLSRHVRPGSLVYIISDFRGLNEQAEHHLIKLSEHSDLVLILIYDPLEKNLPGQGRYRFTDGQRDAIVDTADKNKLSDYVNRFENRLTQLKRLSSRRGVALMQCSTQTDPVTRLRQPWQVE